MAGIHPAELRKQGEVAEQAHHSLRGAVSASSCCSHSNTRAIVRTRSGRLMDGCVTSSSSCCSVADTEPAAVASSVARRAARSSCLRRRSQLDMPPAGP